jgi:hypothetical protein
VRISPAGLLCALLASGASGADLPDRSQITGLSKTFLRDSAELPTDVAVKTLVVDAKGKKRRDAQSSVQFPFRGYNAQAERYSFRSAAGLMSRRILNDSVAGNFAVINAFTRLTPNGSALASLSIVAGQSEGVFAVRADYASDCHGFRMSSRFLRGEQYCCTAQLDFAVDIGQLPAPGNVRYLGDMEVRRIHSEGTVQEARMGDDPRLFLIPKRVTTTVETGKGTVTVVNGYTLHLTAKK